MSNRVLALLPGAIGQSPNPTIIYGELAMNQPAPTGFDEPMFVVIPDWSPNFFYQVDGWPAIHGNSLPTLGAPCTLVFDNQGTMRCIWWDGPYS